MNKTGKPMLAILNGQETQHRPVWLMRQAGRYLPEYRKLRVKAGGFLDLCLTPEWAGEITLQPIRRFDLDAAILFADILLIPMALGQKLEFIEGEGPVLQKVEDEKSLASLRYDETKLLPVFETLDRVKKELPEKTTLIGFCGAPWTVACYMIDGNSKNDFTLARQWAKQNSESLQKLIDILIESSVFYLKRQIEAGAEVVQIFDSWAGILPAEDFRRWVIEPTQKIVARLKKDHPDVPIIGFPREAAQNYHAYIRETGVDAVSLDYDVDLGWAKKELQPVKPLQGNLDPALLVQGGEAMKNALEKIMTTFGRKHIINLGHGVVPQTPPEHVADLVAFVRNFDDRR